METLTEKNKKRRKKERKKTAEVFTPNSLVNKILSKLPEEAWEEDKTFLDPASGNGNFLIWILLIKISKGHESLKALKTIYGLDIQCDNIKECRWRLLKVISLFTDIERKHIDIVFQNVRWIDNTRKYRNSEKLIWSNGSLDYDMSFKKNHNNKSIDLWVKKIEAGELDLVNLPIKCNDMPSLIERDVEVGFDIFEEDEE